MRRRLVVLAIAVVGVFGALVGFDTLASSPQLCASCHEIAPRTHTWGESAHRTVACVKCHQPVREWYQLPHRVADRTALLWRDARKHFAGGYQDPVEARSAGTDPVADEICLQCHDPNRKATSGLRIRIEHAEHAKRNGSCVSCHVRTAHPLATRGKALSLMAQCFTCHGVGSSAKAPGRCELCHPSGYALSPASHEQKKWRGTHGDVSAADPRQCRMCHRTDFCRSCHGLDMPHPDRWAQGRTGHGKVASVNRSLCSRCHDGGPDMCTMCHHDRYQPAKGTWVKQHFAQVREEGLTKCLDCHSPLFCSDCHAGGPAAVRARGSGPDAGG